MDANILISVFRVFCSKLRKKSVEHPCFYLILFVSGVLRSFLHAIISMIFPYLILVAMVQYIKSNGVAKEELFLEHGGRGQQRSHCNEVLIIMGD